MKSKIKKTATVEQDLKLDLGCGLSKKEGFFGIDIRKAPGVDQVLDLRKTPWKIKGKVIAAGSVSEIHTSHFVEHLTAPERIKFVNEVWRVLKVGGHAFIVTPHWASCRAFGDLTHQWPPVSEMWYLYLNEQWRLSNAPHNDGYTCNFDHTIGYSMNAALTVRPQDYQMYAIQFYKEAAQDMAATLTKIPRIKKK